MGGPTGIGALLVRRGLRLDPWLVGGEQERARRAGTESVLAAVGWAAACREAAANLDDERRREREQTQQLRDSLAQLDGVEIFGHISEHLGHITCVGIEGIEPQAVLLELDRRSIAVHSGSACASEDLLPSPVLAAMGVDAARSLRVSVGWNTTDTDIAAFESAIGPIIESLRALRR
jgi:cysteine desulfurase